MMSQAAVSATHTAAAAPPLAGAPGRERTRPRRKTVRRLIRRIGREPVALQAGAQAAIGLGLAFQWFTWNDEQIGAVIGIIAAFLALVTRAAVTPLSDPRSGEGRRLVPSHAGKR